MTIQQARKKRGRPVTEQPWVDPFGYFAKRARKLLDEVFPHDDRMSDDEYARLRQIDELLK